jgi:membrane protein
LNDFLPAEVYKFVESTLNDLIVRPHGALLSFSFVGGVYVASNSVNAILNGFKGSSNLTTWHNPLKQRLMSVVLLFVLSTLMVVAIPIMTASGWLIGLLQEKHLLTSSLQFVALHAARWIISGGLLLLSVALLYYAGEPGRRRFRLFSPGTIVTVVLIVVLSQALAFFFRHFTNYNAIYGSIGAILAVQLWIYSNMMVVLIGHELNVSISRAKHDRSLHLRLAHAGAPAPSRIAIRES